MPPEDQIEVTVLLADTAEAAVAKVVKRLKAAGLRVASVEAAIGTVSGSIAASRLAQLGDVAGVETVEEQRRYQLPPKDSPQ